jgi:hypothetical protein
MLVLTVPFIAMHPLIGMASSTVQMQSNKVYPMFSCSFLNAIADLLAG